MRNSFWHELEIEPTSDVKAIKKAYAKKSRTVHPEEHPEEFEKLKHAYEAAILYAQGAQWDYQEEDYPENDPDEPDAEAVEKEYEDIRRDYRLNLASFESIGKIEASDENDYEFKSSTLDKYNVLDNYQQYVCKLMGEVAIALAANNKYKNNTKGWKYLFKVSEEKYKQFKLNQGTANDSGSGFFENINVSFFFIRILTDIPGLSGDVYQVFEDTFFPKEKDEDWQEVYKYFSLKKADVSNAYTGRKALFLNPKLKNYIDNYGNYKFELGKKEAVILAVIIVTIISTFKAIFRLITD